MWFFHYYSFKLSHKSYTLFSLKPPFSKLTFVSFLEVVSLHLHSFLNFINLISIWHLYLPVIFVTCLTFFLRFCKFINLIIISDGLMFLLIQIPMILKCIPYITWLEFLEDHAKFLVILLSIVCPAIAKSFEMLSPSYMIFGFFMMRCITPLLINLVARLDLHVFLPHFFGVFIN